MVLLTVGIRGTVEGRSSSAMMHVCDVGIRLAGPARMAPPHEQSHTGNGSGAPLQPHARSTRPPHRPNTATTALNHLNRTPGRCPAQPATITRSPAEPNFVNVHNSARTVVAGSCSPNASAGAISTRRLAGCRLVVRPVPTVPLGFRRPLGRVGRSPAGPVSGSSPCSDGERPVRVPCAIVTESARPRCPTAGGPHGRMGGGPGGSG